MCATCVCFGLMKLAWCPDVLPCRVAQVYAATHVRSTRKTRLHVVQLRCPAHLNGACVCAPIHLPSTQAQGRTPTFLPTTSTCLSSTGIQCHACSSPTLSITATSPPCPLVLWGRYHIFLTLPLHTPARHPRSSPCPSTSETRPPPHPPASSLPTAAGLASPGPCGQLMMTAAAVHQLLALGRTPRWGWGVGP